jgi:hypothetical protein
MPDRLGLQVLKKNDQQIDVVAIHGPTMAAPLASLADLGPLSRNCARTETRREKRRREWHEGKIRASRERKQHNQATTCGEQTCHRHTEKTTSAMDEAQLSLDSATITTVRITSEPRIVIGIDFGTTFSGVNFSEDDRFGNGKSSYFLYGEEFSE